jgi:hypothetical protein
VLKRNRSPPRTGENRDPETLHVRGDLAKVLKEGKTLDENIVTPFPKRGGPIGPTSGDLRVRGGGRPVKKLIVIIPVTDHRKPRTTEFVINFFQKLNKIRKIGTFREEALKIKITDREKGGLNTFDR